MTEGFLTNVRTAELFFRFCGRYGVKSEKDRVLLLRELTRRQKAKYLRDVSPAISGKKVLAVGFNKKGKQK